MHQVSRESKWVPSQFDAMYIHVTCGDVAQFIPTHYEHAFKLAQECKFDDLLKHLRGDGRSVNKPICLEDLARNFLVECVKGGLPALEVIECLVERYGTQKKQVFRVSAYCGQVDLLEAACERKWHVESTYREILEGAVDGARYTGNDLTARDVLQWLTSARSKHFDGVMLQDIDEDGRPPGDEPTWTEAFADVLCGECIVTAKFLKDHSLDLGFHQIAFDYPFLNFKAVIYGFMEEGASTTTLDFLCSEFGEQSVVNALRFYVSNEGLGDIQRLDDANETHVADDIKRWLQIKEGHSPPSKKGLINVMSTLDTVKEHLPEGKYLQIANELHEAYKDGV